MILIKGQNYIYFQLLDKNYDYRNHLVNCIGLFYIIYDIFTTSKTTVKDEAYIYGIVIDDDILFSMTLLESITPKSK